MVSRMCREDHRAGDSQETQLDVTSGGKRQALQDARATYRATPNKGWAKFTVQLPTTLAIFMIRAYQKLLSPLLGRHCRFYPSCSRYGIQAIEKYGCVRGLLKTLARICRCHPWHPGGFDPP